MGSHDPPQAPIFETFFSFLRDFLLVSWEFAVLAAIFIFLGRVEATPAFRCLYSPAFAWSKNLKKKAFNPNKQKR